MFKNLLTEEKKNYSSANKLMLGLSFLISFFFWSISKIFMRTWITVNFVGIETKIDTREQKFTGYIYDYRHTPKQTKKEK